MKVTFFTASIETVIWRFYLMTLVVVVPFIIGLPFLAILGYPIFLLSFMGVSIKRTPKVNSSVTIMAQRDFTKTKKEIAA